MSLVGLVPKRWDPGGDIAVTVAFPVTASMEQRSSVVSSSSMLKESSTGGQVSPASEGPFKEPSRFLSSVFAPPAET